MQTFDCLNSSSSQGIAGHNRGGFTLVEILVVLLIVTILVGVSVPRLPAMVGDADIDVEVRRLELLFNMARNEAMLDSMEFGFRRTQSGYEFLRYDDVTERWSTLESPYQERKLPDDIRLTVRADRGDFGLEGNGVPPVLILSSGEMTPVELIIESKGSATRTLTTDGYSPVSRSDDNAK
ncbi:MAG: prepilin-type N-terminal cleavage/methylation domain-containing protein [Gammaproteobacteria bacterium]|jgi:general secretion pathway protein H|nr:prepilin-type N-terminal cleavage/methylation domain-containing protein [Gammaproteobacteria bacterium]MBT7372033.1 prepilin-type N-terminal cleavage/methylation domain-containing protein [Gammaproteobacteria bacterium]